MPIVATERKAQILNIAQEIVQTRGFSAFSFGQLAEVIGVKPAAVHYHYATKNALVLTLMQRYRDRLHASLASIDEGQGSPRRKLERFVQLFHATLKPDHRMCLCGMLATEVTVLSDELRDEVRRFFEDNETWLAKVLAEGRRSGTFGFEGSPAAAARVIYGALHGAMISARTFGDANRLSLTGRWLLDGLVAPTMDALLPPA